MTDIIVVALIVAIVGAASVYIYTQKKKGARCIGCSHAGQCGKHEGCNCKSN